MKNKKKVGSIFYEDYLDEELKDPHFAAGYLNAHLKEEDQYDELLFLMALKDVARAHGIAEVAEKADVGRESLYKSLSKNGNPKIFTLVKVLRAIGLKFVVEVDKSKEAS